VTLAVFLLRIELLSPPVGTGISNIFNLKETRKMYFKKHTDSDWSEIEGEDSRERKVEIRRKK
jgi:hypothetical protein